MNRLTTSIPKVFFQRFQAFPIRQQPADELLLLNRHQLGNEFRQRLVDDLLLIIGQQLVDHIQDFQLVTKLMTYLVNKPLTFFIKFQLASSSVAHLANESLAFSKQPLF